MNTGIEDVELEEILPVGQSHAAEDAKSVEAQNQILVDEVAVLHDRWMRAEAETANVRARAKRDIEEAKQYAIQKFAADVVEAAENIHRGLDSIPAVKTTEPEVVTRLRDGFIGIERGFIGMLKRNGIEREDPTGAPFDPKRHQAISERVSSHHIPGILLQAETSAWTLHGRLLRPAMVVVTKI